MSARLVDCSEDEFYRLAMNAWWGREAEIGFRLDVPFDWDPCQGFMGVPCKMVGPFHPRFVTVVFKTQDLYWRFQDIEEQARKREFVRQSSEVFNKYYAKVKAAKERLTEARKRGDCMLQLYEKEYFIAHKALTDAMNSVRR